jgi:disulfide oxidoreductase YuzD
VFYSVIETRDLSLFNQSAQALLKGYFIKKYMPPLTTVHDDLVDKVNFDLQNIHKWMIEKTSFKRTLINLNIYLLDHPITLRIK